MCSRDRGLARAEQRLLAIVQHYHMVIKGGTSLRKPHVSRDKGSGNTGRPCRYGEEGKPTQ